ncbi:hypothetical protein QUA86_34595, partial [Microcoleus sp. F6_B6]
TPNFFGLWLAQTLILADFQPPCHPLSVIPLKPSNTAAIEVKPCSTLCGLVSRLYRMNLLSYNSQTLA